MCYIKREPLKDTGEHLDWALGTNTRTNNRITTFTYHDDYTPTHGYTNRRQQKRKYKTFKYCGPGKTNRHQLRRMEWKLTRCAHDAWCVLDIGGHLNTSGRRWNPKTGNEGGHQGGHTEMNYGNYSIRNTNRNNYGNTRKHSTRSKWIVWELKRCCNLRTEGRRQEDNSSGGKLVTNDMTQNPVLRRTHVTGGIFKTRGWKQVCSIHS